MTLSAEIADAVREEILFGRRKQGDRITQQALAEEFGVSTMPVREALLTLAHEGMITGRTNHTFRVARMSRRDVEDIHWMHGLLAAELAERACERATPELIARLEGLQEDFARALKEGDNAAVETSNWQFHRELNRAADAPRILATLRTVVAQIPKQLYGPLQGGAEAASLRDHPKLIEAFRAGDPARARKVWKAHVEKAGQLVIDYLVEGQYWS